MQEASPVQRSPLVRLFLNPEERRLRAGWRLMAHLILLVTLTACLSLPLAFLIDIDSISAPALLAAQVSFFIAVTLSVFIARRFLDRRSFASLGLNWNRQAAIDILAGIAFTGLMMGIIYLIEWAVGWLEFEGFAWDASFSGEEFLGVLGTLGMFVLVGWQEELLSRGYWLQNLAEGATLTWGVLISSVLFALGHLQNPHVSWNAILGLVLAGGFLAYGYLRTRQLWLSIGLHIGWNFFEGCVFGFQVSGLDNLPRLVNQTVRGPELLTGGQFGPEAGLVLLPGLLLGLVLIYRYTTYRQKQQ